MEHYYQCAFHIYKNGDKKTRPHIKNHIIKAENAAQAYSTAQALCSCEGIWKMVTPGALPVCRHSDIRPILKESALREISINPNLLLELPPSRK